MPKITKVEVGKKVNQLRLKGKQAGLKAKQVKQAKVKQLRVKGKKACPKSKQVREVKAVKKVLKQAVKKQVLKEAVKKVKQHRVGKGTLRWALITELKKTSGRDDLGAFSEAPDAAGRAMVSVPLEDRGGYPLVRQKGDVNPKDWRSKDGQQVIVDFSRKAWLPDHYGQGIKATKALSHSNPNLGTYIVYIAPDGRVFYHQWQVEQDVGRSLTRDDGFNGQVRLAKLQAKQAIQLARSEGQRGEKRKPGGLVGLDSDESLFKLLSNHERSCLPAKEEFHFGIVSARRAKNTEGIRDIWMVQFQLLEAGVEPTWYVDEASLEDYRALGLHAVVGGKLTAARNMALDDASARGKACVQLSDDISAWEYREGKQATVEAMSVARLAGRPDDAKNAAHDLARRYIISPVAAARFVLAKMRGAEAPQPRLGGVYMLGSCARTFGSEPFQRHHFIIGDFFVADNSKVRFDEEMKLKEDYDFTCSHIKAHGSVMRCARMTLTVKHYANSGGACTNRDAKGQEEERNIGILMRKHPGCFRLNWKRKGEVIMRWKQSGAAGDEDADDDGMCEGPETGAAKKRTTGPATPVKKVATKKEVASEKKTSGRPGLSGIVTATKLKSKTANIAERIRRADGLSVEEAFKMTGLNGGKGKYSFADLRYDLARGFVTLRKLKGKA